MRTLTHVILFDIDGTLVSSQKSELDESRRYVDAIREVTGKDTIVSPSRFAGMVDPQICRIILNETGINDAELNSYLPKVLSRMAAAYREKPKIVMLNRGVKDLLDLLSHSTSHVLGVLTGNISAIAKEKLAAAGISQYFKEGFYADNYDDRNRLVEDAVRACVSKYSLVNTKNVIIVGDTPLDVKAARAAYTTSIGIASGVYSMETLSLSGATMTFQDLTPTNDLLSSLSFQVSNRIQPSK
jgi:phosphoglycolate phosphatase-like HAD superfamily hydrolase